MDTGRVGRLVLLACTIGALLPGVTAVAAVDAYITAVGTKQGQIKGDSASGSHVSAVVHNASTGMASGMRQHSAITITKEVDAASPKFAQALATNEVLSQVIITFEGSGAGAGKVAQKLELTDATVSGIRKVGNSEQMTLSYDKILAPGRMEARQRRMTGALQSRAWTIAARPDGVIQLAKA